MSNQGEHRAIRFLFINPLHHQCHQGHLGLVWHCQLRILLQAMDSQSCPTYHHGHAFRLKRLSCETLFCEPYVRYVSMHWVFDEWPWVLEPQFHAYITTTVLNLRANLQYQSVQAACPKSFHLVENEEVNITCIFWLHRRGCLCDTIIAPTRGTLALLGWFAISFTRRWVLLRSTNVFDSVDFRWPPVLGARPFDTGGVWYKTQCLWNWIKHQPALEVVASWFLFLSYTFHQQLCLAASCSTLTPEEAEASYESLTTTPLDADQLNDFVKRFLASAAGARQQLDRLQIDEAQTASETVNAEANASSPDSMFSMFSVQQLIQRAMNLSLIPSLGVVAGAADGGAAGTDAAAAPRAGVGDGKPGRPDTQDRLKQSAQQFAESLSHLLKLQLEQGNLEYDRVEVANRMAAAEYQKMVDDLRRMKIHAKVMERNPFYVINESIYQCNQCILDCSPLQFWYKSLLKCVQNYAEKANGLCQILHWWKLHRHT